MDVAEIIGEDIGEIFKIIAEKRDSVFESIDDFKLLLFVIVICPKSGNVNLGEEQVLQRSLMIIESNSF
jgi:hypothetical protein